MPIKITVINVDEIIESALQQIMGFILGKKLTLNKFLNLKKINTDKYLLLRVINNLLSNAIKVSPKGSEIIIRTLNSGEDGLEFHVIDHGPGFNEEMKKLIFKKYNIAEIKKKIRKQGSGLGLIFCKKAIGVLGGTIRVKDDVDAGADIIFTLPKCELLL
ncbi:MAG: ATP-binding protein [Ignavibacteriaceae bacterium]